MKKLATSAAVLVLLSIGAETSFAAGTIERACVRSDRKAANRALCGCIQDVADLTLTGSDQKLAATFFKNPQKAQDVRQSDRRSHEIFWKRYKNFGETARAYCSR